MIVTARACRSPLEGQKLTAIFGVGLVGGALLHSLMSDEIARRLVLPIDWLNRAQRLSDLSAIAAGICQQQNVNGAIRQVDVVWAAGKAGFNADWDLLRCELDAFKDIVEWVMGLTIMLPDTTVIFHMLSSAGGLFEGQRFIDEESQPRPQRPYGEAKVLQEAVVERLRGDITSHIYRPSSVYGFSGFGGRIGLINALIENSKKHSTSHIFGGLETLRDYVLCSDIGSFLKKKIEEASSESQTYLLASGRPTSVHEMLQIINRVVERPIYLMLDVRPSNANHMTYRRSALPKGWRPTDLHAGVRLVARQLAAAFESGNKTVTSI